MSDDEGIRDDEEPYPIELLHESHREIPAPLDEEDLAEISQLSADIEDAENFELTFEVVETSIAEEPEQKKDEGIERVLSPVGQSGESRLPSTDPYDLEEENDENAPPPGYKKPTLARKSVADKLCEVFSTPPSRKRKSLEDDSEVRTPKSSRRAKT